MHARDSLLVRSSICSSFSLKRQRCAGLLEQLTDSSFASAVPLAVPFAETTVHAWQQYHPDHAVNLRDDLELCLDVARVCPCELCLQQVLALVSCR